MRVRLSDPATASELLAYLRSADCAAEPAGRDELTVIIPRAPSDDQARRELDTYLRAWQAINPSTCAHIVG
jgi:hypothetical protein